MKTRFASIHILSFSSSVVNAATARKSNVPTFLLICSLRTFLTNVVLRFEVYVATLQIFKPNARVFAYVSRYIHPLTALRNVIFVSFSISTIDLIKHPTFYVPVVVLLLEVFSVRSSS